MPISLIVQFACAFGVWIAAEAVGLSGILTLVAFAMTMARRGGAQMPARMRVPIFAVWETAVFVLNAFAFVLIGMQLRPIWQRLDAGGVRTDAVHHRGGGARRHDRGALRVGNGLQRADAWGRHDRARGGRAARPAADIGERHRGSRGLACAASSRWPRRLRSRRRCRTARRFPTGT